MRSVLHLSYTISVGVALLCACGATTADGGTGSDAGLSSDGAAGDTGAVIDCSLGSCSVAGDAGTDAGGGTDAGDASSAQAYCGKGTPMGCTNGMIDCCPPGAPCHAPFPLCDLGNGHCTEGACDSDAGDGG